MQEWFLNHHHTSVTELNNEQEHYELLLAQEINHRINID